MEEWLHHWISQQATWALILLSAAALAAVGKGADLLVDEAVAFSTRWGIPKSVIGATIVSLGTTAPEVAISVFAALKGSPDLALGNAVGSIICDTGLILGIAALIQPLPIDRIIVHRQGWLQFAAGILLIAACIPWSNLSSVFETGGVLPQWVGFVFLALLVWYMIQSVRWSRVVADRNRPTEEAIELDSHWVAGVKLVGGLAVVVLASWVLIPAVSEIAIRMSIPQSIIAATMVAFGTSLPELVTSITAARKGHGELALGNVIGADILNVLFVAGASAAVTKGGLIASHHFFQVLFPAMLFVLIVLRIGLYTSKDALRRPFGFILLGSYILASLFSYMIPD